MEPLELKLSAYLVVADTGVTGNTLKLFQMSRICWRKTRGDEVC